MKKRIGIYGGSFNPIHLGHVAIGRWMLQQHHLDEVWFMVSPQNPLKGALMFSEQQRYEMVQKALQDEAGLVAKDYEFSLPRPSYTWNTLKHLRRDYPDVDFVLIIGGDNWECFNLWRNWKDILWQHKALVFPRHGEIPVSSTQVREKIREIFDSEDLSDNDVMTVLGNLVPKEIIPFLTSQV